MPASRNTIALAILAVASGATLSAQNAAMTQPTAAPLSVGQVVDNLVRKNQERAQALAHSEATRVYHLSYRGFPGDRDAEMTVEASYQSPNRKSFRIVSVSGSKVIVDHVFKKLLEGELEAAQPEMSARTQLNRENYDFRLEGYELSENGGQYVLGVSPKSKSKFVYRGKIWVDAKDFAVVRIEAEPAQNPSFWTKKSEIHHEYQKVEDFWLPKRNESVSFIRMGGRATLTIEYSNYRLTGGAAPQESLSLTTAATGGSD
jgi:outer membrane lipoprotein-sorting protein